MGLLDTLLNRHDSRSPDDSALFRSNAFAFPGEEEEDEENVFEKAYRRKYGIATPSLSSSPPAAATQPRAAAGLRPAPMFSQPQEEPTTLTPSLTRRPDPIEEIAPTSLISKPNALEAAYAARYGTSEFSLDALDPRKGFSVTYQILKNVTGDVEEMKQGVGVIVAMAINKTLRTFTSPIESLKETPGEIKEIAGAAFVGILEDLYDYTHHPIEKFMKDPLFVLMDASALVGNFGMLGARIGARTGVTLGRSVLGTDTLLDLGQKVARDYTAWGLTRRGGKKIFEKLEKTETWGPITGQILDAKIGEQVGTIFHRFSRRGASILNPAIKLVHKRFDDLTPEEGVVVFREVTGSDVHFDPKSGLVPLAEARRARNQAAGDLTDIREGRDPRRLKEEAQLAEEIIADLKAQSSPRRRTDTPLDDDFETAAAQSRQSLDPADAARGEEARLLGDVEKVREIGEESRPIVREVADVSHEEAAHSIPAIDAGGIETVPALRDMTPNYDIPVRMQNRQEYTLDGTATAPHIESPSAASLGPDGKVMKSQPVQYSGRTRTDGLVDVIPNEFPEQMALTLTPANMRRRVRTRLERDAAIGGAAPAKNPETVAPLFDAMLGSEKMQVVSAAVIDPKSGRLVRRGMMAYDSQDLVDAINNWEPPVGEITTISRGPIPPAIRTATNLVEEEAEAATASRLRAEAVPDDPGSVDTDTRQFRGSAEAPAGTQGSAAFGDELELGAAAERQAQTTAQARSDTRRQGRIDKGEADLATAETRVRDEFRGLSPEDREINARLLNPTPVDTATGQRGISGGMTLAGVPITQKMQDAIDALRSLDVDDQKVLVGMGLMSPSQIQNVQMSELAAALGRGIRGSKKGKVAKVEQHERINELLNDLGIEREKIINVNEVELIQEAGGQIRTVSDQAREFTMLGGKVTAVAPNTFFIAPTHMSAIFKSQMQQTKMFSGIRAILKGEPIAQGTRLAADALDIDDANLSVLGQTGETTRSLASQVGIKKVAPVTVGGDVSSSGQVARPGTKQARTGKLLTDKERDLGPRHIQIYETVENVSDIRRLSLHQEIETNYAWEIRFSKDKKSAQLFDGVGDKGNPFSDVMTIDDMREMMEEGVEVGGRKVPMALWTGAEHLQAHFYSRQLMNDTLDGVLNGKFLGTALGDSLTKRFPEHFPEFFSLREAYATETAGKFVKAPGGPDTNVIKMIPQPVADRMLKLANQHVRPGGAIGAAIVIHDDIIKFYKQQWLRTPRFLINNNITNVMMAVASGMRPSSFVQALQAKFKFVDDMEGVASNLVSDWLDDPILYTRTRKEIAHDFMQNIRLEEILKAYDAPGMKGGYRVAKRVAGVVTKGFGDMVMDGVFRPIGKTFDDLNQMTETFFRRAAFIDRTKTIAKEARILGAHDAEFLERMAQSYANKAGSTADFSRVHGALQELAGVPKSKTTRATQAGASTIARKSVTQTGKAPWEMSQQEFVDVTPNFGDDTGRWEDMEGSLGKGAPGISSSSTAGRGAMYVYRNEAGEPKGFLEAKLLDTDEAYLGVAVAPDSRRQGIATELYEFAEADGIDVAKLSGKSALTEDGVRLAHTRTATAAGVTPPTDAERVQEALAGMATMKQQIVNGAELDEMISNLHIIQGSPELHEEALAHVNKWYFDYGDMKPEERTIMRRIFPFWQWQKNIHALAVKLPAQHPGRTMIIAHMASIANDLEDQEAMPLWLKGSVRFDAARNDVVDRVVGGDKLRLRAGGANPLSNLFDIEGFHPVLSFLMSSATGAKTFPAGGKFSDPHVVESFNRKFAIDPNTGRVTDEVEVVRPNVMQEFARAIPLVRMGSEVAKEFVANMKPSEWHDFMEVLVGTPPKARGSQNMGVFPSKSPLTSVLQWFGISTAPAPPAAWAVRTEELKRQAERRYRSLQEEREQAGILGSFTGIR